MASDTLKSNINMLFLYENLKAPKKERRKSPGTPLPDESARRHPAHQKQSRQRAGSEPKQRQNVMSTAHNLITYDVRYWPD